jgi:hypothetical protein
MNYAPLLNFFLGSYSYICNACKQENLNCNIFRGVCVTLQEHTSDPWFLGVFVLPFKNT